MTRRTPACGSELEHGPHEYAHDYKADGSVLGIRAKAGWCAGWTAAEADLCVMIRQVHVALLEHATPGQPCPFRLEVCRDVLAGLHMLHLDLDGGLHGAELVVISGWPAGRWQLIPAPQPILSGTARPQPDPAVPPLLAYPGQ